MDNWRLHQRSISTKLYPHWWMLQWTTRDTLFMQPLPDGKTLFLTLAVMHRWENTGRCTVYISCIWWILQWTTRYSLLMQPQPDWRTLFLLAVVCHNEIKIHVVPYKFLHVLNQMNICTLINWDIFSTHANNGQCQIGHVGECCSSWL